MTTTVAQAYVRAQAQTMPVKPDVGKRLEEIASSVRTKLRETGARIVAVGLDLSEAKKLLGPGKPFEIWVQSACGLSVATAYRWIQAAEVFKGLRLDERPDVLDETDVADIISVSFPQALRSRIQARFKALDQAEADAAEAKRETEREARKLTQAEAELREAEEELTKADAKAKKIQARTDAVVKPMRDKADGIRSKVRDIKVRLETAKGKVVQIREAAKAKLTQAKADTQAAKQAVTEAQAKATEAQAKADTAKADAKAETKAAVSEAKATTKAENKANAWEVFLRQWLNTLEAKVRETFPVEKQAEALQAVGNAVLSLAQTYKANAKAA